MTESQVYWWLMLDNFHGSNGGFQVFIIMILGLFGGLGIFGLFSKWKQNGDLINPRLSIGMGVLNFFFWCSIAGLTIFIPTSKQYAIIKVLPQIANSEIAKEMPEDAKQMYHMAKEYLKEQLQVQK